MKMIAIVDENWGIGKDNNLLFSLPMDMEFFKYKTMGKTVIMGRKTLESFPNGNPLCGRENVVLSHGSLSTIGITVCHTIEEIVKKYNRDDVFVIGGGEVYKELLPYCDTAYITKVYADKNADTFIPNLDEIGEWYINKASEVYTQDGLRFKFCTYKRIFA